MGQLLCPWKNLKVLCMVAFVAEVDRKLLSIRQLLDKS